MTNDLYQKLDELYDCGLHLVKYIVERDFQNAMENGYEKDDLVGYGVLGLLEACRKYDGQTPFRTFACQKIKQRILDYLRKRCQRPWKYLDELYNELRVENHYELRAVVTKNGYSKLCLLPLKYRTGLRNYD